MKLDILAIGSHPDDVELGCGGVLMKHLGLGYKVGVLDLTKGELGSRGSVELRRKEAKASSGIMGIQVRENLGFADGFFTNDKAHQLEVIKMIRAYRPSVVLANAKYDRHPDHGRAAQLVYDACFLAGLSKITTKMGGKNQAQHRPQTLYHYIQAIHAEPDFAVDITPYFEKKLKAVMAYKSQFHNPDSKEEPTFISTPEFLKFVEARALHFGIPIGVKYAEAFTVNRTPGVNNLMELF